MTNDPNVLSGQAPCGPLASLLPAHLRERLQALQRDGLDPFGHPRDCQYVFDRHVDLLEELIIGGTTHGKLGLLLAEYGIRRQDGEPLTRGTISSALSRARERAAAATVRDGTAASATDMLQSAAASGKLPPRAAAVCSAPPQELAADCRTSPRAPESHRRLSADDAATSAQDDPEPPEVLSPDDPRVVRNLRVASILNKLRDP